MSIFRSKTPNYRSSADGSGSPVQSAQFNLCGWLSSLISSPTPSYRSPPPDSDCPPPDDGDCSNQVGSQAQRPPCR